MTKTQYEERLQELAEHISRKRARASFLRTYKKRIPTQFSLDEAELASLGLYMEEIRRSWN